MRMRKTYHELKGEWMHAQKLVSENDREITGKSDAEFLKEYQLAILLELKERNVLTEMQFRHAAESLQKQFRLSAGSVTK